MYRLYVSRPLVVIKLLGSTLIFANSSEMIKREEFQRDLNFEKMYLTYFNKEADIHGVAKRILQLNQTENTYHLTDHELYALNDYTYDSYKPINKCLRTPDHCLKRLRPFVDEINSALSKLPNYEGEVYRQTTLPARELKKHNPGKIVQYPAFTSTSINANWGWEGHQKFIIHSKTGKPISDYAGLLEDEVLFRPGTKFKILKREKRDCSEMNTQGNDCYLINMTEVDR